MRFLTFLPPSPPSSHLYDDLLQSWLNSIRTGIDDINYIYRGYSFPPSHTFIQHHLASNPPPHPIYERCPPCPQPSSSMNVFTPKSMNIHPPSVNVLSSPHISECCLPHPTSMNVSSMYFWCYYIIMFYIDISDHILLFLSLKMTDEDIHGCNCRRHLNRLQALFEMTLYIQMAMPDSQR